MPNPNQWLRDVPGGVAALDENGKIRSTAVPDLSATYSRTTITPTGGTTARALADIAADVNRLVAIAGTDNRIGYPGSAGFGVGICPAIPAGFTEMSGTRDSASDNYGNYQYSDGSVMVWIPAFYYKYGTGANGLTVNAVSVKELGAYPDLATANAAGYALHRAFYDNGSVQLGVFVDKYLCSNNAGTASSIKLGNPLSSNSAHNPFSGLTGAPANYYYGAVAAAKTRGASFFCNTIFISRALALLSLAHGQAAAGTTWCAWYDGAGVKNFPKGCNNNALGDSNDAGILYTSDGYSNAAKTGSANLFSRTTHNGQACGVADLNGDMWEIALGLTSDGTNYYAWKTSTRAKDVTGGSSLATDAWGAAGLGALYDSLGATIGAILGDATGVNRVMGSAAQVLSEAVSGSGWVATGLGIPLAGGAGGSNMFGNDYCYDKRPNQLCPLLGGYWFYGTSAGVWALTLSADRGSSYAAVGFRAASYL